MRDNKAQKYVLGKSHIPGDSEVVKSGTVTGGHAVGTPKHARGAVSISFPYSYKRSRRRHTQPSARGRVDPFTVQSREVMPSARPSMRAEPCRSLSRRVTRGLAVGTPRLARGAV
ncbi:hypothetical protein Bbelb_428220 [Branchiostoma belcheri]|nr:hypothetical protein Bbelb_428220 [Branchiostoma belcheri]